MSPGLRLLVAPAVLLMAALLCYALPPRRQGWSRLLAGAATAVAAGLLLSEVPLVAPGRAVERSFGELVPGVQLVARADPAALAVATAAALAALLALLDGTRRPLQRCGLLLCLTGTTVAALAAGAVMLFVGLEVGNVGALLLVEGGSARERSGVLGFAAQHGAALGLLAAAIQLQNGAQTTAFAAVPAAAVTGIVAAPWALAGAARLLGAAALLDVRRVGAGSSAWAQVAAVPTGLLVLLRLLQVSGGELTPWVGVALIVLGLAAGGVGAVLALASPRDPGMAGRGLCLAAAGATVALAGVGSPAAVVGFAALGLATLLALAGAPAWLRPSADKGGAARWLRAAALAGAAGLPAGYGMAAMLLGAGAIASQGPPAGVVAMALGAVGLTAAVAGARAVRVVLDTPSHPGVGRRRWRHLDAGGAVAASGLLALLPGIALDAFARPVAASVGDVPVTTVDAGAVSGPGGGWAGGYVLVALAAAAVAALCVRVLVGAGQAEETAAEGVVVAEPGGEGGRHSLLVERAAGWVAAAAAQRFGELTSALDRLDGWLLGQPSLAMAVFTAWVCLAVFR